jgi:hypothetical protein
MSLLRALQSDIAPMLMQYLDTSHSQLLEVARPLRNSHTFAWEACVQSGLNLFKFAEHLRGDALCRRTLELMLWSKKAFVRLLASIPETIVTTDFLALACALESHAYNYVPTTVRGDPAFIRALVNYIEPFDPKEDEQRPLEYEDWISDEMFEDRELALTCARKGIDPFGSNYRLHVHDQEIVEAFLKKCNKCDFEAYEKIQTSPWYNRDWVLGMCRDAPETAHFFMAYVNLDDPHLQLAIIETVPRAHVYDTWCSSTFDNEDHREITWRAALRREPRIVQKIDEWCDWKPSDEVLLTRVFRENPKLYTGCRAHIRKLEFVAEVVFSHDGLQIRDSPFVDNKQLALTCVQAAGAHLTSVEMILFDLMRTAEHPAFREMLKIVK